MLIYVLIGLLFVLIGVAGLQFSYLFYIDRLYSERRRYLSDLEKKLVRLKKRLDIAENKVTEQQQIIDRLKTVVEDPDETWAEVIHDD